MESDSTTSSSTKSAKSSKSATIRAKKTRKQSSNLTNEDKSLTSFPSLSPENTPITKRGTNQTDRPKDRSRAPATSRRTHRSSIAALTTGSPSFRGRNALFQDSPANNSSQEVPGALHLSNDQQIKRLIERRGAVELVRQLAEDLASREAEITTYRWRAEARERELKKMLREVEVSNLDIERRLRDFAMERSAPALTDKSGNERRRVDKKKSYASITDGIGGLMEEAIGDEMGPGYLDNLGEDKQATVRAAQGRDIEGASTHSSIASESKGVIKGWKDYLWSGTTSKTSRASSMISDYDEERSDAKTRTSSGVLRRKGLNEELFSPPIGDDATSVGEAASASSKRDSRSASTSWTVKLFAGKPSNKDQEVSGTARGREPSTSNTAKDSRNPSQASGTAESSARAALMKVNKKHPSTGTLRKASQPAIYGSTGIIRSATQSASNLPPGTPSDANSATNLGPVEMDAILPHGTRPPTLTPYSQNMDDPNDYLTDRFGFIYDQRRRKKEADAFTRLTASQGKASKEMLSTSKDSGDLDSLADSLVPRSTTPTSQEERIEDKPTKRWQDYLKIATFPTELLSHTPSTGNIMTISHPDMKKSLQRSPTYDEGSTTMPPSPANALPSTSSVTSSKAEIASPAITVPSNPMGPDTPAQELEPVKLLLTQLTELHDNLQREKTVKWNEFMRKVRAERRKEDEAASDSRSKGNAVPEASLTDGEMIGVAEVGNKGKVGRAKYKEFKVLVLAGIPVTLRAKVWTECSGAAAMKIPGYYGDLVSSGVDDPIIISQIQMDINRTLTDNVFFRQGPGVAKLNEVLLAYSRRNPEVGYCQGMNLITASLLLIMPTAEDAFWVLVSMIENILPRHYYNNSLLASRADQQVLRQYVSGLLPKLSAHLEELSIELEALTFQWFLSLFTDCLSAEALYRVWDVLLCSKDEEGSGGSTFLFQVALALLKLNETQLIACEAPGEVYAYLGDEITNHAISIDGLIKASEGLKSYVRRSEVEERRAKVVELELETIGERERIRMESPAIGSRLKGGKRNSMQSATANTRGLEVREPMPVEG
ncbi:MAG: hypothetical protein MMC23_005300 [Stictis urceolatum]|nr:hypothetical protein [Stictis urceolata]